jgi:hypothetical protein
MFNRNAKPTLGHYLVGELLSAGSDHRRRRQDGSSCWAVCRNISLLVFTKGAIIGAARSNHLELLLKLLPLTPEGPEWEYEVSTALRQTAGRRLGTYSRSGRNLVDFWLETEFGIVTTDLSASDLQRYERDVVSLDEILAEIDEWLLEGIAFGAAFPDVLKEMYRHPSVQIEGADEVGRECFEPSSIAYDEMEHCVLLEASRYARQYHPELAEALELTERVRVVSPGAR